MLKRYHSFGDLALLRRELFESGGLDRDAKTGRYWPKADAEYLIRPVGSDSRQSAFATCQTPPLPSPVTSPAFLSSM